MYKSLFLNKIAVLRSATLFKKRLLHRCFPVNFAKFLSTYIFNIALLVYVNLINVDLLPKFTKSPQEY